MEINITKKRKQSDIDDLIKKWKKTYGSFDSLQNKVMISKCSSSNEMNDYIIWKYLSAGAEFKESIIFESADVFYILSPRRAEILEYLANNEVASIRELSNKLRRNYKNVYDDLKALSKYEFVELREEGRALKPSCGVSIFNVNFER
jgi:predicted transcriptional regulator